MPYIHRKLESKITAYFQGNRPPYDTLLISGVRQCGKSTLLAHLFPPTAHLHINLALDAGLSDAIDATENFADFTFLMESRLNYKIGSGKTLIFDEAQLSKKLGGYVRFFKEKWRSQPVILTGSTLSTLFDGHPNPTGRVVEFTLRPFSFLEFLKALEKNALLERFKSWSIHRPFSETVHHEAIALLQEYLTVGGLPEVVLAYKEKMDHWLILSNIFSFYKRDFENKLGEKLTPLFSQCFLRIAAATGSPIKNASIVQSSSPGYKKVREVLTVLENWHQILRVDCETSKLSKIGSLTPKRYLFDQGIRTLQNPGRFPPDLLDAQNPKREEVGGILENFVLTEFLSTNPPLPPRSWAKTNQSGLVDFVFNTGKELSAVEVKAALSFNEKHLSPLRTYSKEYPSHRLVLANLDKGGTHKTPDGVVIDHVPVYAIDPFLEKNR